MPRPTASSSIDYVIPIRLSVRHKFDRLHEAADALIKFVRESRNVPTGTPFKDEHMQELEAACQSLSNLNKVG